MSYIAELPPKLCQTAALLSFISKGRHDRVTKILQDISEPYGQTSTARDPPER